MKGSLVERRPLMFLLLSLLCFFAAFAFRSIIHDVVIIPLAYLWWLISLYYHVLPQVVIWIILIFGVLFTAARGLLLEIPIGRPRPSKKKTAQGPIESLSALIHKTEEGTYYKWIIANRLGRAARELLDQREGRQIKQKFTPLTGRAWAPPQDVSAYLEAGVNGTFADYPRTSWYRSPRTPLDVNPGQVIEYLESEMESNRNGRSTV